MPTQAERRAATVAAITRAARDLFARRGFAATSVGDIIAKAGATKGGFYYHFSSKEELFRAVLEERQAALSKQVVEAALEGTDALDRLKRGFHAFLLACCKPSIRQIVLTDGPTVMGWDAWREIDARHFGAMTRQGLEDAMREGLLQPRPLEPLVHVFVGAATEAAMACARSSRPEESVPELMSSLEAILDGLR